MKLQNILPSILLLFTALSVAWETEDHEIFRLKDEVEAMQGPGATFYDFLNVKPAVTHAELEKAYKRRSRQLHPDKAKTAFVNAFRKEQEKSRKGQKPGSWVLKDPTPSQIKTALKDADHKFARLSVIYELLRSESRDRYDHFLRNGFPAWRGTGYYYERFRPGLGSVLTALFVFIGGAVHYGVLWMNWSRQRQFVGRYVREARKTAWGNSSGLAGMSDIGKTTAMPGDQSNENGMETMNRRERREAEKERKKGRKGRVASVDRGEGSRSSSTADRSAARKRVTAANGKTLIVNSLGTVWLEEEDEDGQKIEYLLDENEIAKPKISDTMLVSVPWWFYQKITQTATGLVKTRVSPSKEDSLPNGGAAAMDGDDSETKRGQKPRGRNR